MEKKAKKVYQIESNGLKIVERFTEISCPWFFSYTLLFQAAGSLNIKRGL